MKRTITSILLVLLVVTHYVNSHSILHKILQLNENASAEELKIAFEKLLLRWYKSNNLLNTEADLLHLKIVQAYRELKTKMELDLHDKHLKGADLWKSSVQVLGIEVLHSISVPLKLYNDELFRNSSRQLHLVLFYSANSAKSHIINNWFNLLEILSPLGIIMVTVNMDNEDMEAVQNIIGEYPSSLPFLVLLIDGILVPYRSNEFIDFMIIDFIRQNVPDELVQKVNDLTIKKFLQSWHADNSIRVLISQPDLPLRFQYLLTAFAHRNSVKFGFVNVGDEKSRNIQTLYNLTDIQDTFMIFKEDQSSPVVKIVMTSIPIKLLNDSIHKYNFLTLPRITSQDVFDQLCPATSNLSLSTQICVILVIKSSLVMNEFDPKVFFREFILEYSHEFPKASFMYVYNDYQPKFSLPIDGVESDSPFIVALERSDRNHVKYRFLLKDYKSWQNQEYTKNQLKLTIGEIMKSKQFLLVDEFKLENFMHERPPSLISRIATRFQSYLKKLTFENILPYIIFLGTVVYFCAQLTVNWNKVQSILSIWNKLIEEDPKFPCRNEAQIPLRPQRRGDNSENIFINSKCIAPNRELRLHELKAETYNGMVRLLKPGCRTIIVIFDRERADILVSQFYKAIWPYRRNRNLLFGYANMEKRSTLEWYSELVKACLPDDQQDIEINPYFCAGTVLALSGMRKYFCLYHRKHPGFIQKKGKAEEEEVDISRITYHDNELLLGLREWLDKLFDGSGSVIRYSVNHWPEFKIL